MVAPTPVVKGVTTVTGAVVSLKGVPMKPQTTGAVGLVPAWAWMWALVMLSLTSGVWEPVKSMLKTLAVKVRASWASLRVKTASPKDAGLGVVLLKSVGLAGGTSC